ncbi:MAG: DUF2282 domain-containing protein [Rhodospirillales bacterium]|nr:DUF2282 domain-containing protein [Rhodospirillales bacterium]
MHLALAAVLLGAALAAAKQVQAKDGVEGIRCYGIAKAGENDCANASGSHGCAGKARVDYSGADWREVSSTGECLKMGGYLRPFMGVNSRLAGG